MSKTPMLGAAQSDTPVTDNLPADGVASTQRIAALEAQVEALRAELQSLTSTLSHDLRSPLRHVTSFAKLVQDEAGPQLTPEVRGFVTHITSAAKTMGTMLDGLLALSRLGTVAVRLEPVSLDAVVAELVRERAAAVSAFPTTATATAASVEPPLLWIIDTDLLSVRADVRLLREALGHGLDNALKFSAGATPQPHIRIFAKAEPATGRVQCSVQDNGVGFLPAQSGKLFMPFVRLHSANRFSGLGMGLALMRKALQRMDGSAALVAMPEGGCCLTIDLPGA